MRHFPVKFTRQKPLGEYIVDFYCASLRLAIELDGDSHYAATAPARDAARSQALAAQGVRVLRFTNQDVMQRFEGVCLEIAAAAKT